LKNKILVIQTAFLGDVILTTPLIKVLKNEFKSYQIDFLTIPNSVNIVQNNPNINTIISFDKKENDKGLKGLLILCKQLAAEKYEICLTPHKSLRSAILSYATGARYRIGFTRSAFKKAFTHLIEYNPNIHEIERNLSLLKALKIEYKRCLPEIFPSLEDKIYVDNRLKSSLLYGNKKKLFAVAPGSIWPTKRWSIDSFKNTSKALEKHGYKIVLIGSKQDRKVCTEIVEICSEAVSHAGELTLRQTRYLLDFCAGLLTNDSAPLHLAMAASIPVFAIFGATVPEFGFAPFGPYSCIIENKYLACRPCGIHGGKKCPIKTFDCMHTIKPEMVTEKITNYFKDR
jgi:heptosyltransferase-2